MSSPEPPVALVVQARLGSTRLPGKVLEPVGEDPMLGVLLHRLRQVPWPHEVVVATSDRSADDAVAALAADAGVRCVRGSERDVLGRYLLACEGAAGPWMMRVTGDCPLLDLELLDHLREQRADDVDHVRFDPRDLPLGLAAELVRIEALRDLGARTRDDAEREHVTLGLYRHPERYRLRAVSPPDGYALAGFPARLTVDRPEDLALVRALVERLGPLADAASIRGALEQEPALLRLNATVDQRYPEGFWESLGAGGEG